MTKMGSTIEVKYSRAVHSRFKTAFVNQAGIHMQRGEAEVLLYSINKKDGWPTTGVHMNIPVEDIDKIIEALKQMK